MLRAACVPALRRLSLCRPYQRFASLVGTNATAPISWSERNPFLQGLIVTSIKHSIADGFVQIWVEEKGLAELDWRRNTLFFVYGIFVSGNNSIPALLVPRFLPYLKVWNKLPLSQKIRDGKVRLVPKAPRIRLQHSNLERCEGGRHIHHDDAYRRRGSL